MGRAILGVVVGLVVAFVIVFALEAISHQIYPPPAGFDPSNPEAVRDLASRLPAGAFAFVLAGWVLGAALGAWAAVRVGGRMALWPGLVVGVLVLAASGYNVWTIPHPGWFITVGLLGVALGTWLGARTAYGGGAAGPTTSSDVSGSAAPR